MYIIQETHLKGDFIKTLPKGATMIHHGPMRQLRGARAGVNIILSSTLAEGWKKGGHIIEKGGETIGETARLLREDIEIEATN